jgi:hypothetical protein
MKELIRYNGGKYHFKIIISLPLFICGYNRVIDFIFNFKNMTFIE